MLDVFRMILVIRYFEIVLVKEVYIPSGSTCRTVIAYFKPLGEFMKTFVTPPRGPVLSCLIM